MIICNSKMKRKDKEKEIKYTHTLWDKNETKAHLQKVSPTSPNKRPTSKANKRAKKAHQFKLQIPNRRTLGNFLANFPLLSLMKWEMEIEEIEAILEKIWDLHDKLSDAIHSISRFHFLNSIKSLRKSDKSKPLNDVDENRFGFVYAKDFRVEDDDLAIQEAKSLNAIRTALENLEDQLEFFHVS